MIDLLRRGPRAPSFIIIYLCIVLVLSCKAESRIGKAESRNVLYRNGKV